MIWPYHPKPLAGESFSSWLARVAWGNSGKLHTFTRQVFPGKSIWTRDPDLTASPELVEAISVGTFTSPPSAHATHLRCLEGSAFERLLSNAATPWVLPVGVFHRSRTAYGQQFCPLCIENDPVPYYRLLWRLSYFVRCPAHGCLLEDSCRECGAPCIPHLRRDPACHVCGADRRHRPKFPTDGLGGGLQDGLERVRAGQSMPALWSIACSPLLVFETVRTVLSVLTGGERAHALRRAIEARFRMPRFDPILRPGKRTFDDLRVGERAVLMGYAARAVNGWPFMFAGLCSEAGLWRSWALRGLPPHRHTFAYLDVVDRYLSGSNALSSRRRAHAF